MPIRNTANDEAVEREETFLENAGAMDEINDYALIEGDFRGTRERRR